MKLECHLTVQGKKNHWQSRHHGRPMFDPGAIRVSKGKPSTVNRDEIAIKLCLHIPDSLFDKPILEVNAHIKDGGHHMVVDADVADQLAQQIKEQTGLAVDLRMVDPEE